MTKKTFEYDDESFDFGFTTVSEQDFKIKETTVVQQVTKEVTAASNVKVEKIYKMIMPLLLNLKKDADKNEKCRGNRGLGADVVEGKLSA